MAGVCVARGHVGQRGMYGRVHVWQQGGMHGRGYAWWGDMCGWGACVAGEMATSVFHSLTKLAEMAILYSKDLTTAKKNLPPVGLDLVQEIIAG